jgi:hypothetical protein
MCSGFPHLECFERLCQVVWPHLVGCGFEHENITVNAGISAFCCNILGMRGFI